MPAGNYFAGAPNAFAGGMEWAAAQRRRRAEDNALATLIQRYGPEAADPAAYGQLQGIQQRADLHPFDVNSAQRVDNAQNAVVQEYGPKAGDPAALGVEQSQQAQRRRAGLAAATVLQGVRKKGGDMGAAFDRLMPVLPALGFDAAQLPAMRDQILSNPDMVDELVTMLRADPNAQRRGALSAGQAMYDDAGNLKWVVPVDDGAGGVSFIEADGYEPANASLAEGRLGVQREKMTAPSPQAGVQLRKDSDGIYRAILTPGSPTQFEQESAVSERVGEISQYITGAQATIIEPAEVVETNGRDVLGYINNSPWFKQSGVMSATARGLLARKSGTDAWEAQQMLETVKANVGFAQLSNMTRGLGAVSERELMQLEGVLGRLDVSRDPTLLKRDIETVLEMHKSIVEKTQRAITRQEAELTRFEQMRAEQQRNSGSAPAATDYGTKGDDELFRILGGQ